MADTALYVSIAANAVLAVSHFAKGWRSREESNAESTLKLWARVEELEKKVAQLESEKAELERARHEAETYAAQLNESEKRARFLYQELRKLYEEVTGTHQGISVRPPKLEEP